MTTFAAEPGSLVTEAARRLELAALERQPCTPVRDLLPDLASAYAVQERNIARRIEAGSRSVGRKIGLTNPAVQAQLRVDQPDFGFLLDDMRCAAADVIDISRTLQPKIEAEVAFVLAADLDAPSMGAADVVAALDYVVAALEIVDSRISGWDITIIDTVADNASAGLFVLGEDRRAPAEVDFVGAEMTMRRHDEIVSAGRGSDCLGSPLAAVAWLANTARDFGQPLLAGDVILSGSLGPVVPVHPGEAFTAIISGLGAVAARFSGAPLTGMRR